VKIFTFLQVISFRVPFARLYCMFSLLGKYPYVLVLEFTGCSLEKPSFWLLQKPSPGANFSSYYSHMIIVFMYDQDVFR